MKAVLQAYRFLNVVSVDVALGAVVCAMFFGHIFGTQPTLAGLLSLGISVWMIYSADHLMDAYALGKEASTRRHRLHQKKFLTMSLLLGLAAIVNVMLLVYLRRPVLIWGLCLATIVFIYLMLHQYINPFKELLVSILYSGGVLLPALSLHAGPVSLSEKLLVATFVITALINLILFSWFEWEHDLMDKRLSLVTRFGERSARSMIWLLYGVQMLLFALIADEGTKLSELSCIATMNLILLIIFVAPARFKHDDQYRLVGDSIFLLPVLYIVANG